jgi:hypothetical protein
MKEIAKKKYYGSKSLGSGGSRKGKKYQILPQVHGAAAEITITSALSRTIRANT